MELCSVDHKLSYQGRSVMRSKSKGGIAQQSIFGAESRSAGKAWAGTWSTNYGAMDLWQAGSTATNIWTVTGT